MTCLLHEWKDALLISVVLCSQRRFPNHESSATVGLVAKMQDFIMMVLSILVQPIYFSIPAIHQYTRKMSLWK